VLVACWMRVAGRPGAVEGSTVVADVSFSVRGALGGTVFFSPDRAKRGVRRSLAPRQPRIVALLTAEGR
jgi:hypothetical protein